MKQELEVLDRRREAMSISERLLAECQFRKDVRERYPVTPPRTPVGTLVNTIYGPGVVVSEEEVFKTIYPTVKFEFPPIHATGERFKGTLLRFYSYEYDHIQPKVSDCPQCGEKTETLSEGYCEKCRNQNQQDLDKHYAQFDLWSQMSDQEQTVEIKQGVAS